MCVWAHMYTVMLMGVSSRLIHSLDFSRGLEDVQIYTVAGGCHRPLL